MTQDSDAAGEKSSTLTATLVPSELASARTSLQEPWVDK